MASLAIIGPLFLLSGGTALLYQVAFGKRLSTVFGATAYAVSAVLAAFMGGLALGAYLGGRYERRIRRPLVAYGVAELTVGAVCALTPSIFHGVSAAYVAAVQALPASLGIVTALRSLTTALVVLVPTVAMGVTLPWLSRVVAGQPAEPGAGEDVGGDDPAAKRRAGVYAQVAARKRLALLYAINTAGGALGAVLGAYAVLPALGVDATMRAAALVNAAIGVAAIGWGCRQPAPERPRRFRVGGRGGDGTTTAGRSLPRDVEPLGARTRRLLGSLAFVSGLLTFASEVVVTHLLALLIGNSAFALGLMLAVFLTCLSIGAAAADRLERRLGDAALPGALLATAAALLVTLPAWDQLPRIFLAVGPHVQSFAGRELVRAGVALVVLALPTTAMGLTFPLLLRQAAGRSDVARHVGRLTALNTIGAIVGSVGCGYLLLPRLGSESTLRAIALAFATAGGIAAWVLAGSRDARGAPRLPRRRARLLVACWAGAAVAGVVLPPWNLVRMTNGANVYFEAPAAPDELVFVREDVHGGWTSVARRGDVLTLYTNGKFQGDDGGELEAQRSFAHFPALFVSRFGRALVIGLGTGTTLGTIAAYPFDAIDVAETSPAIAEAAAEFFADANRHSLADDRVRLLLNDGRNVLLLSTSSYDLITIELSSVWFAGSANLYSVEFYELCRERLRRGGVLQQWVQLHHIRRRELAVILRTVRQAFPEVALFEAGRQGIIVASEQPLEASRARLAELSGRPAIRRSLPAGARDAEGLAQLIGELMLSGPELDRFIEESAAGGGPLVSTDENLYLEYATPKGNVMTYDASLRRTMDRLEAYRTPNPAARHLRP